MPKDVPVAVYFRNAQRPHNTLPIFQSNYMQTEVIQEK